jgi:transmembrane protein EpsG
MTQFAYFIFIAGICSLLIKLGYSRNNKLMTACGIIIPVVLAFYRYKVGTDFDTYVNIYDKIGDLSFSDYYLNGYAGVEVGLYCIVKLSKYIYDSPNTMFGLCSLLTVSFSFFGLRRLFTHNIGLAYFVFLLTVYPSTLNGVRQAMASAIFLFAASYIIEGERRKYIISILSAGLFHRSAIMLLPLLFIGKQDFTKAKRGTSNILIKYFFGGFLVYLVLPFLIKAVTNFSIFSKYTVYLSFPNAGDILPLLLKFVLLAGITLTYKRLYKLDSKAYYFVIFSIIDLILNIAGSSNIEVKRFASYFVIFPLLSYTVGTEIFSDYLGKRLMQFALSSYAILYCYVFYYIVGWSDIFPLNFKIITRNT